MTLLLFVPLPIVLSQSKAVAQGANDRVIVVPDNSPVPITELTPQQAIQLFEQQLAEARQFRDLRGEAIALLNLGNAYSALGDFGQTSAYSQAVKFYRESLAIRQQLGDNAVGKAMTLFNLGALYIRLSDWTHAIESFEETIELARRIPDLSIEGNAMGRLGLVYHAMGDSAKAINYLHRSLAILRQTQELQLELVALNNLALVQFESGQLKQATETLYNTIQLWELLRAKTARTDSEKIAFGELQQSAPYRLLQKVLIAQNKFTEALEVSERTRNRAFLELLSSRLSPQSLASTAIELPNIQKIKQIAREQKATLVEYAIVHEDYREQGIIRSGESEIFIWVVQPTGEVIFRRADLKPLQQQNTSLAAIVSQSRESIGTTRGSRPTQGTFARGDRVRFKGARPDDEPWEVISVNLQTRTLTVRHPTWGQGVTTNKPIDDVESKSDTSLRKLHQLLIEPIADLLPTAPNQRVIFIPYRELFLAPFPALQAADGSYLIEKHTILTAPSIQVLDLTSQQQQRVRGTAREILVVGNPTPMPGELKELPYAEKEATEVASLFNTRAITGTQATETAVVPKLSQARIIHLATHGIFDDLWGLGSAIALAPSGRDDGFFTAEEILDLNPKLNAELVVLSACDTGRGRITGDGIIGLSRSLILAGVPSVIVSLWKVPDNTTSVLMTEFYRQLQQNPDKAKALRQAMLVTMEQHPSPIHWAAFTLIGEP